MATNSNFPKGFCTIPLPMPAQLRLSNGNSSFTPGNKPRTATACRENSKGEKHWSKRLCCPNQCSTSSQSSPSSTLRLQLAFHSCLGIEVAVPGHWVSPAPPPRLSPHANHSVLTAKPPLWNSSNWKNHTNKQYLHLKI